LVESGISRDSISMVVMLDMIGHDNAITLEIEPVHLLIMSVNL